MNAFYFSLRYPKIFLVFSSFFLSRENCRKKKCWFLSSGRKVGLEVELVTRMVNLYSILGEKSSFSSCSHGILDLMCWFLGLDSDFTAFKVKLLVLNLRTLKILSSLLLASSWSLRSLEHANVGQHTSFLLQCSTEKYLFNASHQRT